MDIINQFLEMPEVLILEELQDALFDPTHKTIQDFKIILSKFKITFSDTTIKRILEKQMIKILKIRPKLHKIFTNIVQSLDFSISLPPSEINPNFSPSPLFKIITNDDVSSFAMQFNSPDTFSRIYTAIETPSHKKPIIQVIIGSRAYQIINYLIINDFFSNYSTSSEMLQYAVRYHDDFLIQTFHSLGFKPGSGAYREAIRTCNIKYLDWIYNVYFYKVSYKLALQSGFIKIIRFFSKMDTKNTNDVNLQKMYNVIF